MAGVMAPTMGTQVWGATAHNAEAALPLETTIKGRHVVPN